MNKSNRFMLLIALLMQSCNAFVFVHASPTPPSGTCGSTDLLACQMQQEADAATAQQEWNVDLYQNQHSFVWEYGTSLIELLDPKEGETILDVGCGTGELVNEISNKGANAIGFDADQNMVQKAKKQFPNLKFFQAPAQNFQLEDGPVDAIFSNAALHWVTSAEIAVACMSRALKPGGRFVVEFGGKGNVNSIVTATLEALEKNNVSSTLSTSKTKSNPWYFPSIGEYSSLLEKYGIEVTFAHLFDRPTVLEDGKEGLTNWLKMFGASFFHDLTNEETQTVLNDVNDKLRPDYYDSSTNQWTADYRRIRIIGKKKALT